MDGSAALRVLLDRAAWRARRGRVVTVAILVLAAVPAAGCILLFTRWTWVASGEPPWSLWTVLWTVAALLAGGAFLAIGAASGRPDDRRLARSLDRGLGLDDRAATVLAIVRGEVKTGLAQAVLADSGPILQLAIERVDSVIRTGVRTLILRRVALACWLLWFLFFGMVVVDFLRLFAWPFGLLAPGDRDVGMLPAEHEDARDDAPRVPGGTPRPGGEEERPVAPDPVPDPSAPETVPQPEAKPVPERTPQPQTQDRGVEAKVRPSHESYREREPILVVVSALPTRELPADRVFQVSLEVDGKTAATGFTLRVGPGAPSGAGTIADLRRLPQIAGKLGPGEHTVVARLSEDGVPDDIASPPAKFRVEGDPSPNPAGGQQPKPRPDPLAANPPQAPGKESPKPREDGAPPPPGPEVAFDPRVVVPLFGEGEEIAKKGLRVALEPGGDPSRPDAPPPPAAEQRVEDAAKRAESQVDRAGVRDADRALVRRYFEELRRAIR